MLRDLMQYAEKGQSTTALKGFRGLNIFGKAKFAAILVEDTLRLYFFLWKAKLKKECYIGPFIGEFGNFLLHMLPFLGYLHSKGIKVHYCGMANHAPFLKDEEGKPIVFKLYGIRDFFSESRPSGNQVKWLPSDVENEVKAFQRQAKKSGLPYLDIFSNSNLYWYSFRNWQLNGRQYVHDLSKSYKKSNSKVVVFPRKMLVDFTANNGGRLDYGVVGKMLSSYFDDVVYVGHPEMSDDLPVKDNLRFAVSGSNEDVIRECAEANLIVTQFSGAMHVGGYTRTPVLLIFKGTPPVKGLDDTIRFRKNFLDVGVDIAFSIDEAEDFVKKNRKKSTATW